MRTWIKSAALALVLLAISGWPATGPKHSPTGELMRQKLEHAHRVLEGLALEDFDSIGKAARKLGALSQDAHWRASNNPEYVRHTETFRRTVEGLSKAAADRNLDAATLAYVQMSLSCVECHKFVRGSKVAGMPAPRGPNEIW